MTTFLAAKTWGVVYSSEKDVFTKMVYGREKRAAFLQEYQKRKNLFWKIFEGKIPHGLIANLFVL